MFSNLKQWKLSVVKKSPHIIQRTTLGLEPTFNVLNSEDKMGNIITLRQFGKLAKVHSSNDLTEASDTVLILRK